MHQDITEILSEFDLSNEWFNTNAGVIWQGLFKSSQFTRYLEVGAFEGASLAYFVECNAPFNNVTAHCVDAWDQTLPGTDAPMTGVENRFDKNVERLYTKHGQKCQINKIKKPSVDALSNLMTEGFKGYFDLVYIDGSHLADDVLSDACLCFHLCASGGFMIFDDYLWENPDKTLCSINHSPKVAIDAFVNIFRDKLVLIRSENAQFVVRKI